VKSVCRSNEEVKQASSLKRFNNEGPFNPIGAPTFGTMTLDTMASYSKLHRTHRRFSMKILSRMILCITTQRVMTLAIMAIDIMALSRIPFGIMTPSIITFRILTLFIDTRYIDTQHNNNQHNDTQLKPPLAL
jgi:hypothetical protein